MRSRVARRGCVRPILATLRPHKDATSARDTSQDTSIDGGLAHMTALERVRRSGCQRAMGRARSGEPAEAGSWRSTSSALLSSVALEPLSRTPHDAAQNTTF